MTPQQYNRKDIEAYLEQAYTAAGLSPQVGKAIVTIESSWNPTARNKGSSAGGLMQFIDKTATAYGLRNKYDPYQSIDASVRYLKDAQRAGINVDDPGHAYLAWQQGPGTAKKLISASAKDPNAPVTTIISSEAARLNGLQGKTVAQAVDKWAGKARNIAGDVAGVNYNAYLPASIDATLAQPAAKTIAPAEAPAFAGLNYNAAFSGYTEPARAPMEEPVRISPMARPYMQAITPSFFAPVNMDTVPMLLALRKSYG